MVATAARQNINRLWQVFKETGSPVLRNHLIEHYTPNVRRIAFRIMDRLPESVEVDDLISAGLIGLMEATDAFEPERGWRFETYSTFRICGAIVDYLREIDWVPRLSRERTRKMTAAIEALEAATGRKPTRDELRHEMKLSQPKFDRVERDQAIHLVSLQDPIGFDERGVPETEAEHLPDFREPSAEDRAECNAVLAAVARDFSVTDALILRFRHLDGETFVRIGQLLGFTESNACTRYTRLMDKMHVRYRRVAGGIEGRAA